MSANKHTGMDLRIGEIHAKSAGQAGKADATGADVVADIFARAIENHRQCLGQALRAFARAVQRGR